jgi:putative FmdB family regulatory protein
MPTYDYICKECGHKFEEFQSMSDASLTQCPQCHMETLQRLIGAGAGLLFKGSGFYLTDYKKSGASPGKSAESSAPKESNASESKPAESKSADSKPVESKPAAPASGDSE